VVFRSSGANTEVLKSSSHIRSLLRGSSMLGHSSMVLGWRGFAIERHEMAAGDKPAIPLQQHFVAVWTGSTPYGERRNLRGDVVPFTKKPGTVSLLPIGVAPALRLLSPTEITVVAFDPEFISNIERELEQRLTNPFLEKLVLEEPEVSLLVSFLMNECESGGPHGPAYAESLAYALAVRFLYLARGQQIQASPYRHISSPKSIRRVLERMHTEFQSDLSLSSLAADSGYSRRHFLRIFEDATSYTPHQYLLQLKIKRAKELLRDKSISLIDVAAHCGFSSQSHMSQIFRKYCGTTPGQIRRGLRHEEPTSDS